MWSRRDLLLGGAALACTPRLSFASSPSASANKLVLIILRGGLDGLAAFPPYGDADYERARKSLAMPGPSQGSAMLDLDGFFGLHKALEALHPFWLKQELAIVHASSSPYRSRSHFDAQKVLENGMELAHGADSGWLNRALSDAPKAPHPPVAIGRGLPLVLRGAQEAASVDPTRPSKQRPSFSEEIIDIYREHPALYEAYTQHLDSQGLLESSTVGFDQTQLSRERLLASTQRTGLLLRAPEGPNIAVLELGGFDTHIRQGTAQGALANRLESFSRSLVALHTALGPSWANTVVAVVTEFGRTVSPNGSGGTDHGTGAAALLLGGAIKGGKVYADWPGLNESALHQRRDLKPTTDLRAVFANILHQHLAVPKSLLNTTVFPGKPLPPLDLIRG
jgi:uncharacterized protein (DUF1501 family)